MFRKIIICLLIIAVKSFFFINLIHGANSNDIVINEVFPNPSGPSSESSEFIELFNKGSESVSITNWALSDTQGETKTYTIPDTTIPSGGFVSFNRSSTSIALNNSDGDGVVLKDADGIIIDQMSYVDTIEDKSWSRVPDGTGSFTNNTSITEKSNNIAPPTFTPTPTNTPTNTPTPIPTTAPTSTHTPTPTSTSTPTPTLKPSKTPTPTPTKKEDDNEVKTTTIKRPKRLDSQPEKSVLGSSAEGIDFEGDSEEALLEEEGKEAQVMGARDNSATKVFSVIGAILLFGACGILIYQAYNRKKENQF